MLLSKFLHLYHAMETMCAIDGNAEFKGKSIVVPSTLVEKARKANAEIRALTEEDIEIMCGGGEDDGTDDYCEREQARVAILAPTATELLTAAFNKEGDCIEVY